MTLQNYQVRSAYMLKPRTGIDRYMPKEFNNKGKGTVSGTSRMASLDDYVNKVEEEDPEPVAPSRKEKIAVKRGRCGNKRGRN